MPGSERILETTAGLDARAPNGGGSALSPSAPAAIVFSAVVLLAHLPLFLLHLRNLWVLRPHYQFFPLLLACLAWLMWQRGPQFSAAAPRSWWATGLLACGLATLLAAVVMFSPWLAAVATVMSAGALLGRYAAPGQVRQWLPVWAVMWLLVPPPFRWDFRLITALQHSTSRMASVLLDVAGVRHLMEGNVLVLPGHRMLVEEACSGINSLLVLLALTALFVVAVRRPLVWAVGLLLSSFAWACLANVVRVAIVALCQAWYEVDLSSGWRHELLGYLTIALALGCLASTDRCLAFLLRPIAPHPGQLPLPSLVQENPLARAWNWFVGSGGRRGRTGRRRERPRGESQLAEGRAVAPPPSGTKCDLAWLAAFALAGILQIASVAVPALSREALFADDRLARFQRSDLPLHLAGWTQVNHEQVQRGRGDKNGAFSSVWQYRRGPLDGQISIDYPFRDWHELPRCYTGNGWQQVSRRDVSDVGDANSDGSCVAAEFSKPTGESGWLLFGFFDQRGNLRSASVDKWPSLATKLTHSPLASRLLGRAGVDPVSTLYQVQVFICTANRLLPEEQAEARRLFLAARAESLAAYLRKKTEPDRKP
ncbi:MAG TPA: exosortase U [Candidatus Anammoximicrobium sp.]|nr:exosortase U [Candidatus Anammoximicrobium sp.]